MAAKVVIFLTLSLAISAVVNCDHHHQQRQHAHQSVARLKRSADMFEGQQHIDQVPDEDLQQQQQEQVPIPDEVPPPISGVKSPPAPTQVDDIQKSNPANMTRVSPVTVANCGLGRSIPDITRIVNGKQAGAGMYPWQVYLRINTNQGEMLCGGSILNENWILTAAHCVSSEQDGHYTATGIEVVAGTLDRFNHESTKQSQYADCAFKHPGWRGVQMGFQNDIALVRIPKNSPFRLNGATVNGVCLPPKTNPRFSYVGNAIVAGWGLTRDRGSTSRRLMHTQVSVISHNQCLRYQYPVRVVDSMVCQGLDNSSPCQGDSGGPLLIKQGGKLVQYGLVSFGPGICNNGKIPNAVYTQVSAHMTWIENTIRSYNSNPSCSPRRIAIN